MFIQLCYVILQYNNGVAYTHEGISSIGEVEGRENDTGLGLLIALSPAAGEQLPLGLEFVAKAALVPLVQSRQNDSNAMVSWDGGKLLVRRVG